jgi:hypothetical protein
MEMRVPCDLTGSIRLTLPMYHLLFDEFLLIIGDDIEILRLVSKPLAPVQQSQGHCTALGLAGAPPCLSFVEFRP